MSVRRSKRIVSARTVVRERLACNRNQPGGYRLTWSDRMKAVSGVLSCLCLSTALAAPTRCTVRGIGRELEGNQERGEPAGEKIKMTGDHALKFPYAGYGNPEGEFLAKDETAAIWTANEADFNHAWHRNLTSSGLAFTAVAYTSLGCCQHAALQITSNRRESTNRMETRR